MSVRGVEPAMRTYKILVADDSNIEAERIRVALQALGNAEVTVVDDGAQAVTASKNVRFDLVLCDYEMPGLNGLQVVRVLRSSWSRLELPILMLTVHDDVHTKVSSFRHGANDYVTKPVQPEELLARVRAQLELRVAVEENIKARMQILEARRLETLGRLAAGVAHELNTPAQFTADNVVFLQKVFTGTSELLSFMQGHLAELPVAEYPWIQGVLDIWQRRHLSYLLAEAPKALEESINGVMRMAHIVRDLREFAGLPDAPWGLADINRAIENTVAVSRQLWSSAALVVCNLDEKLPQLSCDVAALKQAFFNVLVSSVELAGAESEPPRSMVRVQITSMGVNAALEVRFRVEGSSVPEVPSIDGSDTQWPAEVSEKGPWQGLALAHSVVVAHGGRLTWESHPGQDLTFCLHLPEGRSGPASRRGGWAASLQ